MGIPYLESGESIVLTTDRVSIGTVMYQAMLTTRRLILIDSRNLRFEPQVIPLTAVRTVRGGKAATGDPVIILTIQEEESSGEDTRIIIFSQEPAENRKPDRDLWLKRFIELSVSSRGDKGEEKAPAAEEHGGMRPSIRRWVAPDISRPRTDNFPVKEQLPEIAVTPDEPEPVGIAESVPEDGGSPEATAHQPDEDGGQEHQDLLTRITRAPKKPLPDEEPAVPGSVPEPVQPEPEMSPPAGVSTPITLPAFTEEGAPSALSASILAAVQSLTGDTAREPSGQVRHTPADTIPVPDASPESPYESRVRFTSPLPDDRESPSAPETPVNDDMSSSAEETDSGNPIPVSDVVPEGIRSTSQRSDIPSEIPESSELPQPSLKAPPAGREPTPQPAGVEVPAGHPHGEVGIGEPDGSRERQEGAPPAPPRSPVPHRALITGGIIVCLLLVIAGLMFLPGTHPGDSGPVTVIPTPVQTPTIVIMPTLSASTQPQNGTWVKIVSPGYFIGLVGNPGSLVQVSGSNEEWFRVRDSRGLVKVSAEKQEYSGDELRVEVYSNGRLIASRSTTAPRGAVDMLIDPATGEAPGMTETPAPAGSGSRLEYL